MPSDETDVLSDDDSKILRKTTDEGLSTEEVREAECEGKPLLTADSREFGRLPRLSSADPFLCFVL